MSNRKIQFLALGSGLFVVSHIPGVIDVAAVLRCLIA
jgi:hypothetical protein